MDFAEFDRNAQSLFGVLILLAVPISAVLV